MIKKFIFYILFLIIINKDFANSKQDTGSHKENAKIILIERNSTNNNKINLNIKKIIQYKNLEISLISCFEPKNKNHDHAALILIEEFKATNDTISKIIERNKNKRFNKKNHNNLDNNDIESDSKILFYGWIFNNHKYVNSIKHPIIDLWLEKCF